MRTMNVTVTSHKGGQAAGREKVCGVYRIRNVANGRCYVGSALDVGARPYNHRWHLDRGTHRNRKLLNAWRKRGNSSFVYEVLETVADPERLIEKEQHWMDALEAYTAGYNLNPKAASDLGRVFGAEVRERVAEGARRAMADPAVKERHAAATKEAMRDPDVKRRTSAAARKRWAGPEYRAKMAAMRSDPAYKKRVVETSKVGRVAAAALMDVEERSRPRAAVGKASSRSYAATSPAGDSFTIHNLKGFCRENGIPYGSAIGVVTGRMKRARVEIRADR